MEDAGPQKPFLEVLPRQGPAARQDRFDYPREHASFVCHLACFCLGSTVTNTAPRFRLAELQLGYIMSKLTVPDIEDALVHLPANLDESYANVIPRIKSDPVYRDIGMDTMMWLLKLPPRLLPAPVGFIRHCLAASIHGSEFRCEEGLYREENILEACRGLVTLQSDARGLLLDFDRKSYWIAFLMIGKTN